MNEKKHTPGPWTADAREIYDPSGEIIARVYDDRSEEEYEMNIELIRTAPELLEALKVAVSAMERCNRSDITDAEMTNARAAIAKAEGRGGL